MKIDHVIAWVNGNDPKHRESRKIFPPEDSLRDNEDVAGDTRFLESGEIYYNIASVSEMAKFVDKIYIVTDNQNPRYIDDIVKKSGKPRDYIQIVDHRDIFDGLNAATPNFNSLAIESVLWRIPGLSEHFIYSNDDMFLNAPARASDFFRDGKPVLRGKWSIPERDRLKNVVRNWLRTLTGRRSNTNPAYRKSLDNGAVVAGSAYGYLAIGHHPHPMRKSTLRDFFRENEELLNRQVAHRYRNIEQFNPVSLANHLEMIRYGVRFEEAPNIAYFDPRKLNRFADNVRKIKRGSAAYGCIQSLEKLPKGNAQTLHQILCRKFKKKLPTEVRDILLDRTGSSKPLTRKNRSKDLNFGLSHSAAHQE